MLENNSQFGDLHTAFEQFRDPLHGFMVHAKQRRPSRLRELLSGSASLHRITFDREIWHLDCQTFVMRAILHYNFLTRIRGIIAWERAEELRVEPQLPPDVLGVYVYLPNQVRA